MRALVQHVLAIRGTTTLKLSTSTLTTTTRASVNAVDGVRAA